MSDDTAIQLTYVIARAITDAGFIVFWGLFFHGCITAISSWPKP